MRVVWHHHAACNFKLWHSECVASKTLLDVPNLKGRKALVLPYQDHQRLVIWGQQKPVHRFCIFLKKMLARFCKGAARPGSNPSRMTSAPAGRLTAFSRTVAGVARGIALEVALWGSVTLAYRRGRLGTEKRGNENNSNVSGLTLKPVNIPTPSLCDYSTYSPWMVEHGFIPVKRSLGKVIGLLSRRGQGFEILLF